jgi:hypothetical protein
MTEPALCPLFDACHPHRPSMAVPRSGRVRNLRSDGWGGRWLTRLKYRDTGTCIRNRRCTSEMAGLISGWPTTSVVVVHADGDIDEINEATMADSALMHGISTRGLILDLSGVESLAPKGSRRRTESRAAAHAPARQRLLDCGPKDRRCGNDTPLLNRSCYPSRSSHRRLMWIAPAVAWAQPGRRR